MFAKAGVRQLLVPVVVLLIASVTVAQQGGSPAQADGKIHLAVVVTPKSGVPEGGLTQQDFTLLDNKHPKAVSSFQAVSGREAPIEIVLVIDAVNATFETVSFERDQVEKYLRAENGHLAYPVALALMTDEGTKVVGNFSLDGNDLSAKLDQEYIGLRILRRSAGLQGAAERWQISIQALRQLLATLTPHKRRKIMVWFSPGWPLLPGATAQLDEKQERQIFADIVNISTAIAKARVTIYSIDPLGAAESVLRSSYYMQFVEGVRKPSQVDLGDLGLPVLALQSGGLALSSTNDLTGALQQCLTDSVPYYDISFEAPASSGGIEYHRLEIRLEQPGLKARTLQGYYTQPAPQVH